MEEQNVPYIVFEGMMTRMERVIKNLMITILIIIILLFASNLAWLYVFNQYDFSIDTVTLDSGEGTANYIGQNGVINNGED